MFNSINKFKKHRLSVEETMNHCIEVVKRILIFVKRDIHHHLFLRLAINQLGDCLIAALSCCLKGLVAFLRTDSNFGCS